MTDIAAIHIGTSGWHYKHWEGVFYPKEIKPDKYLSYYKNYFSTVEINNSFYKLPKENALKMWRDTVPTGFIFAMKASRFITHNKKLKEPEIHSKIFLDKAAIIGKKLGPILFHIPPYWNINLERLNNFLNVLPKEHNYVFEFRDSSWFNSKIYNLLQQHNAGFCIYDMGDFTTPKIITANFIYVRMHSPPASYGGNYAPHYLAKWADDFINWAEQGKEIYCYFNNDIYGYAVKNALALRTILDEK